MRQLTRLTSKFSVIVCATILAAAVSASAKAGETRTCETKLGGQVVCGDYVVGITLEQYEAGLKERAEEIRAEETEKRILLQKLTEKQVELTERATTAEKDGLRRQIAAVEAEKRALEAESKGVTDRLTNLQASYDGLVQKLAEANAALAAFAPLISTEAFAQAQAMLSRGDVLGAERKFVEIADTVRKIREQADVVEARAIFEAGKLAEERIDWRAASAHYARASKLQPSNWQYAERAGKLAHSMGDYATAAAFVEATLSLVTSTFGPDARETAMALNTWQLRTYHSRATWRPSRSIVGPSRSAKRFSARIIPTLLPVTTTSLACFRTRASMTKPSRSFVGPSRSVKRFSARTIPTLRSGTTTSPVCLRTRANMMRPSRSIVGPSR